MAMTLVDYGSGSESDGEPETSNATAPGPVLPPPSSRPAPTTLPARGRKLQLPALAASTMQAVADLDSKPADKVEDEPGPARKKPKLGGGSGKGGGLASMLPPPKSATAAAPPTSAPTTAPAAAQPVEPSPTKEPAVDFFGLGSFASAAPRATAAPSVNSAPSVTSSAPVVKEERPPAPSLLDPYPGYWQRDSGEWVARDASTDPVWAAFYEEHYASKDGQETERTGADGMVEFDAAEEARKAREARPEIIDPREEARQLAEAEAETKPQKAISRVAKGRHQLSSLLADAQSNRTDLEERIARAKVNRRAAGARYGF